MIETPYRIEPCVFEDPPKGLVEKAVSVRAEAARLGADLHGDTVAALAHAVRIADTRFSHLIEGIDVAPEHIIASNWVMGERELPADRLATASYVRERWRMDQGSARL